jgi:hypothetical protein
MLFAVVLPVFGLKGVTATVSGSIIGKALEASTSDGEVVEGLFA